MKGWEQELLTFEKLPLAKHHANMYYVQLYVILLHKQLVRFDKLDN